MAKRLIFTPIQKSNQENKNYLDWIYINKMQNKNFKKYLNNINIMHII